MLDEIDQTRYRNPFELNANVKSWIADTSWQFYVFIGEIKLSTKGRNAHTTNPDGVITFANHPASGCLLGCDSGTNILSRLEMRSNPYRA